MEIMDVFTQKLPKRIDISPILDNHEVAYEFLIFYGILHQPWLCRRCNGTFYLCNIDKKLWKCRNCGFCRSIYESTLFHCAHLKINQILEIGYLWLLQTPTMGIITATGLSSKTVSLWLKKFRDLIKRDLIYNLTPEEFKIGGEGIIVEIDESKFGKRKYNQGHAVEGVWVVGGIERLPHGGENANNNHNNNNQNNIPKAFAISVPNRDAATLLDVILNNVNRGSCIITDCWRGYRYEDLLAADFDHWTVNHSINFVDPITLAHTNTVESLWSSLKTKVNKRVRTSNLIDDYLYSYIWYKRYKSSLWGRLLYAIQTIEFNE